MTLPLKEPSLAPSRLKLRDVCHALIRFRGILVALSGLGLAGALLAFFIASPVYESEAKLMVRRAPENKATPAATDKSQAKAAARDSAARLNAEIEILTSLDLAREVVEELRPESLLARTRGGNDPIQAAALVRQRLQVEVRRQSNVLRVRFRHRDPAVAQRALRSVLDHYGKRHVALHGGGLQEEVVSRTREELRQRLEAAEAELRAFEARKGIALSLEDTRKACLAEITRIRQLRLETEAALAECKSAGESGWSPSKNTPASAADLPLDKFNHYTNLCAQLNTLMSQQRELLRRFTEENAFVQRLKTQLAQLRNEKTNLEAEFPKLTEPRPSGSERSSEPANTSARIAAPSVEPAPDPARAQALEAKLTTLSNQLARLQGEAAKWEALEPTLVPLERQRSLAEANYQQFSLACEQARLRDALEGQSINLVQTPSPPVRVRSRVYQTMGLLAGGGLAGGAGLALLLGLVFHRAAPRPAPPSPLEPESFSASIQPLRKGESRKERD
jgi:uncharacterized protein involved in exopolysaccharide biosynthesis